MDLLRATLANADFTVYIFLRFFWITTLPNIWRKTLFSKALNQGFSIKGKGKSDIENRPSLVLWKLAILKNITNFPEKTYFLFKSVNSEFLHYVNQFRHFRLYFIAFFSLVYANYWNKFLPQYVSRLYSYKKRCNVLDEGSWSEFICYLSKFFSEDNFTEAKFNDSPYTKQFIWDTLTSQSIKEKPF